MTRRRAEHCPIEAEKERFLEIFDREKLISGYLKGRSSVSQVLYSRRRSGRRCFVNYTASLTRHPMTGDVVAFITEQECNSEKVKEMLLNRILARQFDAVAYLAEGRYGVVIGDTRSIERGNIFPITRSGDYDQYLESQVIPRLVGDEAQREAMAQSLRLETVERRLEQHSPYVAGITCEVDGEVFHKRFDFYAVDSEARFYILLASDTTAIQEEQMARNRQLADALEEAQQANVAKTAFLSRMSHEIRTPMNAIIGLDAIALREPDLSATTRNHLEKIGESARYLLSLINDILDMSRIESGKVTLKNEEFSFRGLLEQINAIVYSQSRERGLQYDCVVHGKVDERYIGDAMKLKQVLINILGNAVKFTPPPGRVSLSVERAVQSENNTTLRFTVKDTGIGMDKAFLPKLFDPFSQEDGTNTSSYGGSGLGLAIARNIIGMMNGDIQVESEKGVGSAFTVNVMVKNADPVGLYQQDYDVRPNELKVLVIDDDPVACRHAGIVLEEIGIACDTCLNGPEALDMIRLRHARRDAYNVILVDMRMPGQDGIQVTRAIRQLIGDESAIIILTAYSWADVEADAISAGVDAFMSKPLFGSSVLYEFQQALQRKKLLRPEDEEPVDLTGRRVLLAEDVLINAEIMKQLLSMHGMEVEHAENGRLAVDMFDASPVNHFDAVLMDVRMPEMDGLQATEAIRALKRPDSKRVPIIAMTANAFDEDVQRSLQAGMDAHLSKPVEPERLFDTLRALIRERGIGADSMSNDQ